MTMVQMVRQALGSYSLLLSGKAPKGIKEDQNDWLCERQRGEKRRNVTKGGQRVAYMESISRISLVLVSCNWHAVGSGVACYKVKEQKNPQALVKGDLL